MMTEKELIKACRNNQREAQFTLVRQFAPRLLAMCRRYVPDGLDAEDTLQDAFSQIFSHLDQFDSAKGTLFSWLCRVTINCALKKHRLTGRWHLDRAGLEDVPEIADLDHELNRLNAQAIESLVRQLPEGQRHVFNLVAIEGYSHRECGELLGMATGTSRAFLARARQQLQQQIIHMETQRL
ncbi:MAG: sigma-70 family RNA polymerase sigma factor [Saprospiraceae bacterium]|nr:sigma-70 family RNA polymerase sigma factor [Saprospiraceae bacterium]